MTERFRQKSVFRPKAQSYEGIEVGQDFAYHCVHTLTRGAVRRGAPLLRDVALGWLREADLSEPEIYDMIQQCVAIAADQEGAFT